MQKRKHVGRTAGMVLAALALLAFLNFLPAFRLETRGMHRLEGDLVTVCYEQEESAARDVFESVSEDARRLSSRLGVSEPVTLYLYDRQSVMQTKKYGYIASWLGLDWYIGDNIGAHKAILTSPANPPSCHDYNSILSAASHEIAHAYIAQINPHISKWLTEGTALYLTNGETLDANLLSQIPSYADTTSNDPVRFSRCGGYQFSNIYIEYLEKTYGWDKVYRLLQTEDYEACFGLTRRQVYDDWTKYLQETYR